MALAGAGTRVAIIGASGIGKHHAKWWNLEGADVCAIAGSSTVRVARACTTLRDLFGFSGHGYDSVAAMLRDERPDVVDICSPPNLHAIHCDWALEAGAHVLCEKPFVFDPRTSSGALLEQAHDLVTLANRSGLHIGVCTQYSVGARIFRDLWHRETGEHALRAFVGHLESPARAQHPNPIETWVDLAPHPISMLLEIAPRCQIDWNSLRVVFESHSASAPFCADLPEGGRVRCELTTRNTTASPTHVRRCAMNDWTVHVNGFAGSNGIYRAKLVTARGEMETDDFMRALIRHFLEGNYIPNVDSSIENLTIMLRILELAVERSVHE